MSLSDVPSTTTLSDAGSQSSCLGGACPFQAYMWCAMIAATCCPFVAFCCCCICNKWYLTSGPYAGLRTADICPRGKRCMRPCYLICAWCCPSCFVESIPPPATDDAATSVDLSTASAAAAAAVLYRPPPSYDEAVTMPRPRDGEVVIFVSGCDETFCSFRFSKGVCDPPAYSFPGGN